LKVLIIGFFTRTYMPYLETYEKILKNKNISYDIVCFDRDCTKETYKQQNMYVYSHKTTANRFKKMIPVFKYARYIKKIMKENNYDKIIVLTTMPGILIYKSLLKKYKNKYIFDYRDYTYEKYTFFKNMVNRLIDNSYATFVSSEGYKKYFNNQKNIFLSHNISNMNDIVEKCENLSNKKNIEIGFLGYVRYYDVNTKLINDLKDDKKYSLTYIGTAFSDCDLPQYCKDNKIENVSFIGKYDNRDKAKLYSNIDMINSIYSLNSAEVQPAIPNRLYDAALFKKPIIVNTGTYLSNVVEKYNLGLIVDPFEKDLKAEINRYIDEFDADIFTKNCETFLNDIEKDSKIMEEKIDKFFI